MRQIITCPHCGAVLTLAIEGVEEGRDRAAYIGGTVSLVEMARIISGKARDLAEQTSGMGEVIASLSEAETAIDRARSILGAEQ